MSETSNPIGEPGRGAVAVVIACVIGCVLVATAINGCRDEQPVRGPTPTANTSPSRPSDAAHAGHDQDERQRRISQPTQLGQWAVFGPAAVRVDSARIGRLRYQSSAGGKTYDFESSEDLLVVAYTVENRSDSRKFDCSSPSRGIGGNEELRAYDDKGNWYREQLFKYEFLQSSIKENLGPYTLYPKDKPTTRVVCFERLVPAARWVVIEFPPDWLATGSRFQFAITADQLSK